MVKKKKGRWDDVVFPQMCSSCVHIDPERGDWCMLKQCVTQPMYVHNDEHRCGDFNDYFAE